MTTVLESWVADGIMSVIVKFVLTNKWMIRKWKHFDAEGYILLSV